MFTNRTRTNNVGHSQLCFYLLTIHPIHPTKLKETLETLKPLVRPRSSEQLPYKNIV